MNDETKETKGAFLSSLVRNNRQIREDRALAIHEVAEITYKRRVENIELKIKQLKRERDNMLDLSPTNAQSLVLASDFKEEDFVNKDITLGIEIRNLEIQLEIARERYQHLFVEASNG